MPATLTDRRPADEYRLAAYMDRWPLLSVAEAVAELAALDAATTEEDGAAAIDAGPITPSPG